MRKQLVHSIILSLCFFLLTSCAPSPEVIGTQTSMSSSSTAAAWTQTLTPTKTPTQTPTITPTVTPSPTATALPTATPPGGSSQLLLVGLFRGVPSIYLHDFNTGTSKVLLENHDIASVSPDEKHLLVYVKNWKASLMGPIAGELYLTTLDGAEPILISSNYLTNGQTDWIDNDTFTYTDMKAGNFKYYEYKVSSASVKELPEPYWSNDNFDPVTGMIEKYSRGECQLHYDGMAYDRKTIYDCTSPDGQYIYREIYDSKPVSVSIWRMDGSVVRDLTLTDEFLTFTYGFWSPNSQFLILRDRNLDTNSHPKIGILKLADLSFESINLSEMLPEWPTFVNFSIESFSPDGNQLVLWHNSAGDIMWSNTLTTLILESPTNTVKSIELGLPLNTELNRVIWLHE